ncbi:MAG: hypothetical protein V4481_01565 [Patescibacteria group bacterium]
METVEEAQHYAETTFGAEFEDIHTLEGEGEVLPPSDYEELSSGTGYIVVGKRKF